MRTGCSASITSTGMLERFCEALVTASEPVLVGPAAPGAADHVDDDEGLAVGPQPADADDAVAALAGRRHALGHDLRKRAEHGIEHAVAGERPRRARRRHHRIEHRGLRHLHLDAAEQHRRCSARPWQHAAHAQISQRMREAERRVERALHLRRRAGVVDQQRAVIVHGDRDLDRDRRVGKAVVVDVVDELVAALRPGLDLARASAARHSRAIRCM